MSIVCQQMILMKYHSLFVIFGKKSGKIWNGRLLQIIGGALWANHTNEFFKVCHVRREQSDPGPYCLQNMLHKNISRW